MGSLDLFLRIVAVITAGLTVAGVMLKLLRAVDRVLMFFDKLERNLDGSIAACDQVSKKLNVMFDAVDEWLKMFEVNK